MKLFEAIEFAVNQDGIEVLRKKRFANYLADLQAYETPVVRRVVTTIVKEGYGEKLYKGLTEGSYNLDFNDVNYHLVNTVGYQEGIVKFVLNSILYALHKTTEMPSFEYNQAGQEDDVVSAVASPREKRAIITKDDISNFFDLEADAAKNRWDTLMRLSVKDRIRKRKTIKDVYLDKDYSERSDEGHSLLKVRFSVNLSDFKEGEYLILHKENTNFGISCSLYEFEGDNNIILDVYSVPSLDEYYDVPLVLDKDKVDLRQNVYSHFLMSLTTFDDHSWRKTIINSVPNPTFNNAYECENYLKNTIELFNLSLLPKQKEAILRSMQAEDYYLIQGPPGTGKSFVLGIIMLEEVCDLKHNVIIIGPNHMAINNAMEQAVKLFPPMSRLITKVGQSYNAPTLKVHYEDNEYSIDNAPYLNLRWPSDVNSNGRNWLIGLTPHALYTRRARGLECDTLIIDEAGQMTIPLALMGMIKARKVIFAGDHKQLSPIVSSERIRPELKRSAFERLISDDNCTMLDTSFRMCEPICDYVSELFYDGRLKAMKSGHSNALICQEKLYSFDAPVILHEIEDTGEQVSDNEAVFIADAIAGFISKGIKPEEIAVLSPFRAQAANIRRTIRKHPDISAEDSKKLTSDTVDKMQGQEREVIFYSLVSGDWDYMNEMAEFLYNPNKMNVAFSRAKSKLIIVGSLRKISKLSLPQYPHIKKLLNSKFATKI
ncbi:MAG: AAA family ATPase [Bacteroides heparinolyticus]|nr:AAA family ATPase [Bacteroides heparinolyticus]